MNKRLGLFASLQEGAVLITPNNRLSAELLDAFCQSQLQNLQEGFVQKPQCLPYQAYLQRLFRRLQHQHPEVGYPVLLTKSQERFLWTEIISASLSQYNYAILNPGLIDEVMEAWLRCQRWQIDINQAIFRRTEQSSQFQSWAEQFQDRLSALHAISEEQLLAFFLKESVSVPKTELIWYCFEDFSPLQQSWQHYLESQGCRQRFLDLEPFSDRENISLFEAENEEQEQLQLMLWIQERQRQGDGSLGIIVPDLQNKAEILQRLLEQKNLKSSFNISLGKPLSDFPILSQALSLLKLNKTTLSRKEAQMLLYSPFLGGSLQEKMSRLQSLQDCNALEEEQIDLALFVNALAGVCPKLAQMLDRMEDYPDSASVLTWIALFKNRLQAFDFPGEQGLSSESYQCYSRLLTLFDEFKELGLVSPQMSRETALQSLDTLSHTAIFQVKTQKGSIQVLGMLEATGSVFDSVWVTHMTNECLPQKTRLSAFIPASLQRELEMPHASTHRELELGQKIMARLKNCSRRIVFSYPRLTKDKPNLPSPLLGPLPKFQPLTEEADNNLRSLPPLEPYQESYLLPLLKDEKIKGGTTLIANQAKCPFRSFAAHRLHLKRGAEVSDGLNNIERGKIIHKVMEDLWRALKNQQTLMGLPEKELEDLVLTIIQNALKPYQKSRPHSFPALVQEVEVKRLQELIAAMLAWEKSRPAFEVESIEQAFTVEIAGLSFQLRIDRLDKCIGDEHEGSKWVIDYKSSLPGRLPWNEERPTAPQLLMYALLDEQINTLLFASLKEGNVTMKGISEDALGGVGINQIKKDEDWQRLREGWQEQIRALVEEYQQGLCVPQPVSPAECQLCDFKSLCRYRLGAT